MPALCISDFVCALILLAQRFLFPCFPPYLLTLALVLPSLLKGSLSPEERDSMEASILIGGDRRVSVRSRPVWSTRQAVQKHREILSQNPPNLKKKYKKKNLPKQWCPLKKCIYFYSLIPFYSPDFIPVPICPDCSPSYTYPPHPFPR